MLRTVLICIGIVLAAASGLLQAASQQPSRSAPSAATQYRVVLDRYCVTCHNEKLRTANLLLDKSDVEKVAEGAPLWEKVVRKLRTGAMPPTGMPRPDHATYDSFATYLETALDRASLVRPNPGRPPTRRLNRAEYTNAVRDLLSLDINGGSFLPADESTYGFDNVGDSLSVSPMLLERYLSAARKISRLAIGDPASRPVFETYGVPMYLMQEDRVSEDLPFGSRGGIAVRHYFPVDGEYVIRVRLQKDSREYIRGLAEPHHLDVRLDGERIKLFTIGGEKRGRSTPVFSSAALGDPAQEEYERTADQSLEVRVPVKAGTRVVGAAFVKETLVAEGALQPPLGRIEFSQWKGGDPAVDSVSIGGPYDVKGLSETPSRRKIFVCRPTGNKDEEACAKKILSTLARRAYRRPVTDTDLQPLLRFYKVGRDTATNGQGFEAGIQTALERILVGPEFLFLIERAPENAAPDAAYRLGDLELASRLSFFLWSSLPDDELLDLAARGKLKEPAVLEQQVRRMLADSRSQALVSNFAGQWLYLRNLRSVNPDPEVFPYWDDNLRDAFRRQTELFFESIVREDRPVMDLLDADYTFLNERLARHYGIPNIFGSQFRRVTLQDEKRRGLLGQGSILTVTSYANRTSPVIRGKWVLDNILGAPPPPPPPNVPALKDRGADGKPQSVRQRLEQHRANPVCASCHSRMDPLGFALENFDATGGWRAMDANTPIDSSGVLPDGTKFQGPAELRKILLSRREEFVNTVTEKLLTYALGRGVEYYDAPAIRKVMREASPGNYRWSSLILGIVKSTPFQMRRSPES